MNTTVTPRTEVVTANTRRGWLALFWVNIALYILLIFSAIHLILFYFMSLFGVIGETISEKYAIYVAIGTFSCLFIYGELVKKALGYSDYKAKLACTN